MWAEYILGKKVADQKTHLKLNNFKLAMTILQGKLFYPKINQVEPTKKCISHYGHSGSGDIPGTIPLFHCLPARPTNDTFLKLLLSETKEIVRYVMYVQFHVVTRIRK